MILGLGLDCLSLPDLRRSLKSAGFRRQVFSPDELAQHGEDLLALARAFALKEAFVKALGTGRIGGVEFHEISWLPARHPGSLRVVGGARERLAALGAEGIRATSTQRGPWILGVVILERSDAQGAG